MATATVKEVKRAPEGLKVDVTAFGEKAPARMAKGTAAPALMKEIDEYYACLAAMEEEAGAAAR